jgi:hypothetical protein
MLTWSADITDGESNVNTSESSRRLYCWPHSQDGCMAKTKYLAKMHSNTLHYSEALEMLKKNTTWS